jgi:hypothetical protein
LIGGLWCGLFRAAQAVFLLRSRAGNEAMPRTV